MSLTFFRYKDSECDGSDGTVRITSQGCLVEMQVSNLFQRGVDNATYADHCEVIRTMLDGRNVACMFETPIGDLWVGLKGKKFTIMSGGQGHSITKLEVDYQANKTEVDKFLNFLLDAHQDSDEDD